MKLLYNANIHTMDPALPEASAIAIENGRILAVGLDDLALESKPVEREDMGGRTILPGLMDAHIHLQDYAQSLEIVDCEVESKAELLKRVSKRVHHLHAGQWLLGHGWNQNTWGGAWPTAADLDEISPQNPVYLTAKSLHVSWANSLAMQLAGISASTPNPKDGRIQHNSQGQLTGIFFEDAVRLIEKVIPEPDPEILASKLKNLIESLWRMGLTGAHDFDKRTCFQALQILHARGELQFRVIKSLPRDALPSALYLGLRTGFGDDMLRIGSVKLFADGALGPHTCAMFEPYVDEPENCGILVLDNEQLYEYGCKAVDGGLSLAVHAIGDRAIHEVLEGFARLREYERVHHLPVYRHRIEHVQTIHPQDANRLAKYNLIASMQPIHAPSDMPVADHALGGRTSYSYAWRLQLASGARLAFGSDAPVESPNPFRGLHAAVTRRRSDGSPGPEGWIPEQRLTIHEALSAYTQGPSYAAGMDHYLGKLSAGFLADLIVIDIDPFTCDPAALYDLQPDATMVGGEWVWRK